MREAKIFILLSSVSAEIHSRFPSRKCMRPRGFVLSFYGTDSKKGNLFTDEAGVFSQRPTLMLV